MNQTIFVFAMVLCNAFACASRARADTAYKPFELNDAALYSRSDLQHGLADLPISIPNATMAATTELESGDAKIRLFDETARLVRAIAAQGVPQAEMQTTGNSSLTCEALESWPTLAATLPVDASESCKPLRLALETASKIDPRSCLFVKQPELRFRDLAASSFSREDMESLPRLISRSGKALSMISTLDPFFKTAEYSVLQNAFRKIWFDEQMQLIASEKLRLQKFAEILLTKQDCMSGQELRKINDEVIDLSREINSSQEALNATQLEGLQQAAKDADMVSRAGRKRGKLAYPALSDQERFMLANYLGGVFWRIRGAGLFEKTHGTQRSRLWYTQIFTETMLPLFCGDDCPEFAFGSSLRYRLIMRGWGQWFDMGHSIGSEPEDGRDQYYDLMRMTERGSYQVEASANALREEKYDESFLRVGGLQMGPCYWEAWHREKKTSHGVDLTSPYANFLNEPPSWGELCAGSAIYLGLAKSFLNGHR